MTINGDLAARVAANTDAMEWQPSPSGTVWRKRLHLVGPPESGQVTSVVRYEPKSSFPEHDHPDGEEIFVLEGIFSDAAGDWPAGTYLLNPEGFRHAPHSVPGCVLFVKLRQYPGTERRHIALSTFDQDWRATGVPGVSDKPLYEQDGFTDRTRLERLTPGAELQAATLPDGAEIFVLDGVLEEAGDTVRKFGWLRLPPGSRFKPFSASGCTFYIKEGGFRYLAAG